MSCVTSHCQERLILLHFVPVDSNLHFSLVKHLVPCVTTKDCFLFSELLFLLHSSFPLVPPNPSSFSARFQAVLMCVPTVWAEGAKRRHVACGCTYIYQDRTHEVQSVWISSEEQKMPYLLYWCMQVEIKWKPWWRWDLILNSVTGLWWDPLHQNLIKGTRCWRWRERQQEACCLYTD